MFECPNCKADATRLIIYNEPKYLGCPSCGVASRPYVNVNLGQTVEKWTHINKQGEEKKHRITVGKDWELSNRALAEDGKTVINKVTNKEAQY
jgi:hypothetical protein